MVEIRKIQSAEESERKRKRNTLILSIIMIAILVFSTAGYFTFREEGNAGNEKVENVGGEWIIKYGEQSMRVSNAPEIVQNTTILTSLNLEDYYGKVVYVSSNDEEFYEMASSLGKYTERMQPACFGECEKNLPEKNCTSEKLIVVMPKNESEGSKIYEEDNCLFITGGIKAVDAFIYKIFNIV